MHQHILKRGVGTKLSPHTVHVSAEVVTIRLPGVLWGASGPRFPLGRLRSSPGPLGITLQPVPLGVNMFILMIDMSYKVNSPDPLNGRGL